MIKLIIFGLSLALATTGIISIVIGIAKQRKDIVTHGSIKFLIGLILFILFELHNLGYL
ncbi:hypothetical protein [Streptococcus phocae]|uniref:hypothetical protein n=1 Tax=Streptococcus phocae TaxID=119224 RepID=UPI000ADC61C1|nr:hypothetical protein [Streptococcus phocae]